MDLEKELRENAYPGRGIVVGLTKDGKHAAIAYFIMGRSENSRNRVFVEDGTGIRTQAHDPAKLTDPSLIIYAPVRTIGNYTVVTNGDQTDTIVDGLDAQMTWAEALSTREFEPDAPNFTPRISGLLHVVNGHYDYQLSVIKSADGDPSSCRRYFFAYANPRAGEGHFIHTYARDVAAGEALPSFTGEPKSVEIGDSLDAFTDGIWAALNEDNKVSLFTRFIDLSTGAAESRIINKNK
ncbi:MAG: IMP cyclohydrolase [Lachnospiraceae bacterium]|nr:IMP cyclohydrolase [Lachnospiraceae bacterium]